MQAPVVSSVTFDKSAYNRGDTITATVNYVPGKSDANQTFTGVGTDSVTGLTGMLAVSFTIANGLTDATSVAVFDGAGRTWVKTSDSGTVAVYTSVA